jgi:tetratricopeptide (TPR) repeat protein
VLEIISHLVSTLPEQPSAAEAAHQDSEPRQEFSPADLLDLNNEQLQRCAQAVLAYEAAQRLESRAKQSEAKLYYDQAIQAWRGLVLEEPYFSILLSRTLLDRANCLLSLRLWALAVSDCEESIKLNRDHRQNLKPEVSDALDNSLALTLSLQGQALKCSQRYAEALPCYEQAEGLFREFASQSPLDESHLGCLSECLTSQALLLCKLDKIRDALPKFTEVVVLLEGLARRHPRKYNPELKVALARLASCLNALGRSSEAQDAQMKSAAVPGKWATIAQSMYSNMFG